MITKRHTDQKDTDGDAQRNRDTEINRHIFTK